MSLTPIRFALLALLTASPWLFRPAQAAPDEAAIRAALARLAPQASIERLRPSPLPGVTEVVLSGQVYYVSDDGAHVIAGSLVRSRDGVDLTEISRSELRAAALESFPESARIRFAPQSPAKHRVTVFTAVDCGYCRRFHSDIDAYLAQGIAIDYVLMPLAGPNSPADDTSARVHCAVDRQAAFTAATFGNDFEAESCDSSYGQGLELARRLGVDTTPTIIADDGSRIGGYMPPQQLVDRLNQLAATP